MKKVIASLAMTASIAFASMAQADTLAGILTSDGDMFDTDQTDFDIVTQALLTCSSDNLAVAAGNDAAELTAFLPTDKAFRILVEDVFGVSIKDEAALFGAIAGAFDCPTIETILAYHIVPGIVYAADVVELDNGTAVPTASLLSFEVIFKGKKGKGQIRLVDNEPMLRDPVVVATDIEASNGVAHVIDRVLLPIAVIEQ